MLCNQMFVDLMQGSVGRWPACLHLLGFGPKALGSGLQPFKALTFAQITLAMRRDSFLRKDCILPSGGQSTLSFNELATQCINMIKYV